jgi:hypothetical protein
MPGDFSLGRWAKPVIGFVLVYSALIMFVLSVPGPFHAGRSFRERLARLVPASAHIVSWDYNDSCPGTTTTRVLGLQRPRRGWTVRIGVNVPNFGPGTDPGMLRSWAQTVEGLGFDLLMVSDHVAVTPDVAEQYPAPFYEPFTTLAWLAGLTSRVRLRHHGPHSAVPAPAADRPDGRQP